MSTSRAIFAGGSTGVWRVDAIRARCGTSLEAVEALSVHPGLATPPEASRWALRGVAGHERYVERREHDALKASSPALGRPEATCAAFIPIRKNAVWWAMSQDERRRVFEEESHHIADSLSFLPRIARRLYHARDLGEPFDFLTWFEFAPEHASAFEDLVGMLRERREWSFVEREVDVRLSRVVTQ